MLLPFSIYHAQWLEWLAGEEVCYGMCHEDEDEE